jgi:hypothetical protein
VCGWQRRLHERELWGTGSKDVGRLGAWKGMEGGFLLIAVVALMNDKLKLFKLETAVI